MSRDPLNLPTGWLMRPVFPLDATDSVEVAATRLNQSGGAGLPVVQGGSYAGRVDQSALGRWIGDGNDPLAPVESLLTQDGPQSGRIAPYANGAEVLRLLEATGFEWLTVVDDLGRVMGVVAPSDLIAPTDHRPRPRTIGGMATPFGVYLTTGNHRAGVSDWALMSTGALMFTILLGASLATDWTVNQMFRMGVNERAIYWTLEILPFALFVAVLRSIPLAAIHAAEHQVVHAIERGEPLRPEVVRRMPRVHPRCGTNFAVGLSLFLGLATATFIPEPRLQLLLAVLVTLAFWRPLGSFAQYWITTRKPKDKHLAMGIRSGEQLIEKLRTIGDPSLTLPRRILNSGLLQVMSGALLVYGLAFLVARAFGVSI